jgi:hypothetical protein
MSPKENIYYLLREYINGNYEMEIFCDEYTQTFDIELDYNTLNEEEYKLLAELSVFTGRFSPFEEDLKIPNVYFSQEQVMRKIKEVYNKLIKQ